MPLSPITLTGRYARLEPLDTKHIDDLFAAAQDDEIWLYMLVARPRTREDVSAWVRDALEMQASGQVLPFAIIDHATNKAIGSTRYLDISERDRHVEIGWTWLSRAFWRTPINTECKYLLLKYAFEELNCIRVQLKTDLRNDRSQQAIARLGAVREGVLRKAMITRGGFQRWSVYFSIIDDDWPAVKERLEGFLNRAEEHNRL